MIRIGLAVGLFTLAGLGWLSLHGGNAQADVELLRTEPRSYAALGEGWTMALLPRQSRNITRYSDVQIDGRAALKIEADASYGALMKDLPAAGLPSPIERLSWQWRVDEVSPRINLSTREGDDNPAKVCVGYDWPDARVPYWERQALKLVRLLTHEPLPGATLCYTWGNTEARETLLDSPYTRRVRVIVLRNQAQSRGVWFDEDRRLEADFRRAFGDELRPDEPMPSARILFVSADTDNTKTRSLAFLARFQVR